jgi:ABC-type Fe3+-siderophore transport system permease subunit
MKSMPADLPPVVHKNKTLATFLALLLGFAGLHRFYLHGLSDRWGWLHALSLPLTAALLSANPELPLLMNTAPLVLSMLIASIETFVLGLMPDEKWDARYNPASGRTSDSRWPIALMMVLNLFYGATLLLTVLARAFDLMLTGGAYG